MVDWYFTFRPACWMQCALIFVERYLLRKSWQHTCDHQCVASWLTMVSLVSFQSDLAVYQRLSFPRKLARSSASPSIYEQWSDSVVLRCLFAMHHDFSRHCVIPHFCWRHVANWWFLKRVWWNTPAYWDLRSPLHKVEHNPFQHLVLCEQWKWIMWYSPLDGLVW